MRKFYKILFLFVLVNTSCVLNATNGRDNTNLVLPTATISGTKAVCQNAAQPQIMFTGSDGTAPYTFTYKINGGANLIVKTSGTNNTVTVNAPTNAAGVFTYNLQSVEDSATPSVIVNISGNAIVTVNPSPDASMGGTGSGSSFNGVPVFRICSNTVTAFTFTKI